jgi:hypothetical protein
MRVAHLRRHGECSSATVMRNVRSWIVAVGFVFAGCGGGGGGDGDARGPDAAFDPTPQFDDRGARVEVSASVSDTTGSTYVAGHLITAPRLWPYAVDAPVGSCRYSSISTTNDCSVSCDYYQYCVDGVCLTEPPVLSAGDLSATSASATRAIPYVDGAYYLYENTDVFPAGTSVTVAATGAEFPAFSATTEMPAQLALIDDPNRALRAGDPLTIAWEPADPGSRVRITLGADRGHASLRAALIECDLPDEAGSVVIPEAMITRFVDPQNWSCGDCFSHELKRYRRARTDAGPTPVDVWLSAGARIYLVPEPD